MTLIEQIDGMDFSEDDARLFNVLTSIDALSRGQTQSVILVAAARHLILLQYDTGLPNAEHALEQFCDLVRLLTPQYGQPRPNLSVVGGTEFHPTKTPTGADNAQ